MQPGAYREPGKPDLKALVDAKVYEFAFTWRRSRSSADGLPRNPIAIIDRPPSRGVSAGGDATSPPVLFDSFGTPLH